MDQASSGTPWSTALLLSRLATTGATVAVTAGVRAGTRGLQLCIRRSPILVKLAVESGTSPGRDGVAQSGLRDEVLGLVRELAELSWREARRALDDLDAGTRVEQRALAAGPCRRVRVKP